MKLALAVTLTLLVWGCKKEESTALQVTVDSVANAPDQELFGSVIRLTRDGRPRLTLRAPHLNRYEGSRLLALDGGIRADFYDEFGVHQAVLTAERGEIIEGVNKLSASGRVYVKSDSGIVLRSEELQYEDAVGRIETPGVVTVVSEQDSLAGYGFSSAPDLTDWVIKNTSGATWRSFERDTTLVDSTH